MPPGRRFRFSACRPARMSPFRLAFPCLLRFRATSNAKVNVSAVPLYSRKSPEPPPSPLEAGFFYCAFMAPLALPIRLTKRKLC